MNGLDQKNHKYVNEIRTFEIDEYVNGMNRKIIDNDIII